MVDRSIPVTLTSSSGTLGYADEIQLDTAPLTGTLASLSSGASVQAMAAVIDGFNLGGTPGTVAAAMVTFSDDDATGVLSGVSDVQTALERLDNTGIGADVRTFSGSFFANYVEPGGNQAIWYGGRQAVSLEGTAASNGNYTFELPDISELTSMFDDLQARGLAQEFTITIGYRGGNTQSVVRNSLTIRAPSVSALFNRNEIPVTLAQGTSATFRITRTGGNIGIWERLGVQQSGDPIPTFGEVVLQSVSWNNSDLSFLPSGAQVQKGYAFPVIGSSPNDGTLRQGLLDSGVSDRVIYDGDYVVWTADAFTSWTDGNNWFVLNRNDIQRFSREESNFLAQVTEIDNRVDLAPVSMLTSDALVWLSENPLAEAPFLTPSTDPNNPRSGDNYPYVGGRENRNAMGQFTLGSNRFNSYITLGITPSFISGHNLRDIEVRIYDTDRNVIDNWNLEDDFTFVDDATFTNGTVRHYQRNTSINYPFLATIEIWLTQVQRHFRLDANSVDVTQNIPDQSVVEDKLSADVQEKLNRAIPPQGVTYDSIQDRLSPYANVVTQTPVVDARFFSGSATSTYPSSLADFSTVPANNPVFEATTDLLFVAVPEPGDFILRNLSTSSDVALDNASPNVEVIQSFTDSGVSWFVYRITSVTVGNRFEVERVQSHQVVAWANDIENLQDDIERIDAELSHAALNLPDAVVDVLDNNTSVTEESTPTVGPSDYNRQLAGASNTTQTVFYEPNENPGASGSKSSRPLSELSGDQVRRKLLFIPPSQPANQQSYITAFDGSTGRDLISYINGEYLVNVRVPAQPASSTTNTVYPAPATRVSGAGIWQTIPALTFVNGVPVPEADELFFTRNIPSSSTTLTIQYRGHANGNIFGAGSATLAGVGGPAETATTFNINDGSETLSVEVRWYPNTRQIRVSETARVNTGLPTINDVQVILSYTETITIPATPGTTRQVAIENVRDGWQVFAFKPADNGNLIVVGDQTEIDTNRSYETWFGASLGGHITVADENARFLNFEDFNPIDSTLRDLENHAALPQFGLFSTTYTHETVLAFDVALRAENSQGDAVNLGEELVLVAPNNTRWRLSVDASGNLSTTQVT